MSLKKIIFSFLHFLSQIIISSFNLFLSKNEKNRGSLIFIWTSDPWGIILSGRYSITALKNKYADLKITIVVHPDYVNFLNRNDIRSVFGLSDEDEIIARGNIISRVFNHYDAVVIPSISKFSMVDHLAAGALSAEEKIGFSEVETVVNPYSSVLSVSESILVNNDRDSHFAENLAGLLSGTSFKIDNIFEQIRFAEISIEKEKIYKLYNVRENLRLIGFSNHSDLISKKWDNEKIIQFVKDLSKSIKFKFFVISDSKVDTLLKQLTDNEIDFFFVEAGDLTGLLHLINVSDLVVTTNNNIMHLAGITKTSQISLFGDRNPFKWSPVGENKVFLKKSDFVNSISAEDLISKAEFLLKI